MVGNGFVPMEGPLGPLLPEHLSEFFAGLAFAALLAILIQRVVVPRFERLYAERSEQIAGGIKRAEQAQLEAQQSRDEYQQLLSSARDDANQMREQARQQGAKIVEDARAQGQRESERMLDQARSQISAERDQAFDQLRTQVGALATTLAGRLVGEQLSDQAAAGRSVDRFLAELADQPARGDAQVAAGTRSQSLAHGVDGGPAAENPNPVGLEPQE